MFGISFSELIIILLIAGFFLKPEEIKTIFIKCKKLHLFVKQELRIFDSFSDTEMIYDENISLDGNEKKPSKTKK
jgi:Sec-independent protein translocase protein TatA